MFKKKILPILTFISLLLLMALFQYIPIVIFHIDINKWSKIAKVIYNFGCDIAVMIIIFFIYRKTIIKDFKDYLKDFGTNFELSFKYYFIGLIIMIISNLIITFLFKEANAGNEEAVRELISAYPIYMFFSVSIYAPFIEEIIFRKSIRDSAFAFGKNKITKYLYIFISGFIFAALHVLGSSNSYLDYIYIIPYLSLGISFASLYCKSDNIFSSISMHCLHNTVAIILYLVVGVV